VNPVIKNLLLPNSWKWCKAEDCMDVRDGTHDSPKYISEGYPLVTSKNLINGKLDFSTCTYISKSDHDAISKRSAVDDGDILYAMIGTIGNPVIVKKEFEFSIKNVALLKFNNDSVLNKYIYYFLESDLTKRQFERRSRGGTQKFVSLKNIRELMIPLPPLAEQQKIAAILDAADQLRQKDQQLIDHYTTLSQSLFLEMFGDPVTNPMGWETTTLKDVIEEGPQNGLYKPSSAYGDGVKIIRIDSFHNNIVEVDNLKRVQIKISELNKFEISEGNFVINRVNSPSHLGKCGLVPKTNEKMVFESNMMRVKFNKSVVNNSYMLFILSSRYIKNQILNSSKDAVNQSSINQKDVNSFIIPLPPFDLQNQFAQHIQKIEQQKQLAQASLKKSETLFNSLLQRAFKGELTNREL